MYCTQRLRLSQAIFQVRCGGWKSWLLLAPYKWSERRRNLNPRLNSVHLGLQDRVQIQPTLSVPPLQTMSQSLFLKVVSISSVLNIQNSVRFATKNLIYINGLN